MAMATKARLPVIFIVHGAWHVPAHFEELIKRFQTAGYEVHCPLLPTSETPATANFYTDVSLVHGLLDSISKTGRQIIVLAHSYGGAVSSQAVEGIENIAHVVYMCAFMLQPGQTVADASQPRPPVEPIEFAEDGSTVIVVDAIDLFYHDVSKDEAEKAKNMLVHHSLPALMDGVVTYAPWKYLPCTYIVCTEDRALSLDWQQNMISPVKKAGGNLAIEEYESSHSPFLSMPDRVVDSVLRVIGTTQQNAAS